MSSSRSRFALVGLLLVAFSFAAAAAAVGIADAARRSRRLTRRRRIEPSAEPVALTVGLGYIPSVQFAPFYLAEQAGYYRRPVSP